MEWKDTAWAANTKFSSVFFCKIELFFIKFISEMTMREFSVCMKIVSSFEFEYKLSHGPHAYPYHQATYHMSYKNDKYDQLI
jgi:hypothetical protein